MSTRNSSARNQMTGFDEGNETWAEFVILYTTSSQMLLDSQYNRIFLDNCQRFTMGCSCQAKAASGLCSAASASYNKLAAEVGVWFPPTESEPSSVLSMQEDDSNSLPRRRVHYRG